MADADGELVLFGLRKLVLRLMERTGLDEQFRVVETEAEALALLDNR
jgi:anti-anti-sigma regulatory factor